VPLRTTVCGPCWAACGGQAAAFEVGPPPEVATGSRDPTGQREWLDRLGTESWVEQLQARTRYRLGLLARELMRHADWDTFESWPGWEHLIRVTGWARRTVAGWLRQLRLSGWLTTLEHGSTPQTRPLALLQPEEGNRRAVYALRVPLRPDELPVTHVTAAETVSGELRPAANAQVSGPVDKTCTPTWLLNLTSSRSNSSSTRAHQLIHNSPSSDPICAGQSTNKMPLRGSIEEEWVLAFASTVPLTEAEMLVAACELRVQHPMLARLSPRWMRSLARPYWRAGWSNDDVLHALIYRPTSTSTLPTMPVEQVYSPAGWVRSRLTAWRNEHARILASYSQRQASLAQVRARHGQSAGSALPVGCQTLLPEHITAHANRASADAGEALARSQRRDAAARAAGLGHFRPDPPDLASAATRWQAITALRDTLARRRGARNVGRSST
jgi:hypothetical protein